MNRTKNALCAALLPAMILVAGCSPEAVPGTAPIGQSTPAASSAAPTTAASEPAESKPVPNDLKKSPLRRTFKSAGLTVMVEYSAVPAVSQWTPNGAKSIRLFMTAVNKNKPGRKIYVTRASVRVSLRDARGDIQGPEDPPIDSANISPGYLVTGPYSYNQTFSIPPLDDTASAVILDFKFETATLVDAKAKDYTKQTLTDTVRVAVNF